MNWQRHPELLDRLAAEYALGTMPVRARRRFEAVMRNDLNVQRAAAGWGLRLHGLEAQRAAAPLPAPDRLWRNIEAQAFGGGPRVAAAHDRLRADNRANGQTGSPPYQPARAAVPWWRQLFGPAPAAAMVFGLAVGVVLLRPLSPDPEAADSSEQMPASYVGVLAELSSGRQGLIVASRRRAKQLDVKVLSAPSLVAGQRWVLWSIDAKGQVRAVLALPELKPGFSRVPLADLAETLFAPAVELALSQEPDGTALPAAPSQAFTYRGLCGKLWPPPPAAAAATARPAASR